MHVLMWVDVSSSFMICTEVDSAINHLCCAVIMFNNLSRSYWMVENTFHTWHGVHGSSSATVIYPIQNNWTQKSRSEKRPLKKATILVQGSIGQDNSCEESNDFYGWCCSIVCWVSLSLLFLWSLFIWVSFVWSHYVYLFFGFNFLVL